jgi:glycosyltransferase involved in cell wall biosynthesis
MLEHQLASLAPEGGWEITGWLEQPESMLCQMDVFVLCSHFEGLPLSLLEAAASGVACVVTPFNGAADVALEADWVHVLPDHSTESLRCMLESVLHSLKNKQLVQQQRLDEFREKFSTTRMAIEMMSLMGLKKAGCTL